MRSLTKITFSVQHYQFLRLYYTVPQDVLKCPWLTFDLRACLLTNSFLCLPPQKNDTVLSAPFSTFPSLLSSRSQALSPATPLELLFPSSTETSVPQWSIALLLLLCLPAALARLMFLPFGNISLSFHSLPCCWFSCHLTSCFFPVSSTYD